MTPTSLSSPLIAALAGPAADARQRVADFGGALASGRVTDAGHALSHDFSSLGAAERTLALSEAFRSSVGHGRRTATRAEAALADVSGQIERLRDALVPAITGDDAPDRSELAAQARDTLAGFLRALNATSDGRSVFGGGRSDLLPIPDGEAVLADLDAIAATASDAADLANAVSDYFSATGAFRSTRLAADMPTDFSFATAPSVSSSFDLRADDPAIIDTLERLARIAVISGSPAGRGSVGDPVLDGAAHGHLAAAADVLIDLRAQVGRFGADIDRAAERLIDMRADALSERSELLGIDPYESATRLEEEAARLETIYALTARLGRLRLTDYLR